MTGILLIQLGTPDKPTSGGLRPYLREFLSDPRVIETKPAAQMYQTPGLDRVTRPAPSSWKWKMLLRGVIVPFRSISSAKKYKRVWDNETGSPLMHYTVRQTELLAARFPDHVVRFGMTYGNPSVESVVNEMMAAGVDRLVVIPMYPQYSATTTAAGSDALFRALMKLRVVPAIRIAPPYYLHPAYLSAVEAVAADDLAQLGWEPEHTLFSFHGVPRKYVQRGDPYALHCVRTTAALAARMELPKEKWSRSFQSRLGGIPWLTPYTDETVAELAKKGVKRLFVILPGFTADCLETIDEVGHEAGEEFQKFGGEVLRACPCLNDHPKWIDTLEQLAREEGQGWLD